MWRIKFACSTPWAAAAEVRIYLEGARRFQLKFAKLATMDGRTDGRVNGDASGELNYTEEDLRSSALWFFLCLSFWFVVFQSYLVVGKEDSL